MSGPPILVVRCMTEKYSYMISRSDSLTFSFQHFFVRLTSLCLITYVTQGAH